MQKFNMFADLISSSSHSINIKDEQLCLDIKTVCSYCSSSIFRIAVFAPFNHGKSTLLNALLGSAILPINLIPTTGTAIKVAYANELSTAITMSNGSKLTEKGTNLLEKYAVLDDNRHMREDVNSIEVFCPSELLKLGAELIDLPGTNDMEGQNKLVFNSLLSMDLIVHVLDARKLFTLEEVDNIHNWIINRGIKTVIFVVNFVNLLEINDQDKVMSRVHNIASEFRFNFPSNISNVYRVDALPALRAKLKNDFNTVMTTGLQDFEKGLFETARYFSKQLPTIRSYKLKNISSQMLRYINNEIESINYELNFYEKNRQTQIETGLKKEKELKKVFEFNVNYLEQWSSTSSLFSAYHSSGVQALSDDKTKKWCKDIHNNALNLLSPIEQLLCHKKSELNFIDFPSVNYPNIPDTSKIDDSIGTAVVTGGVVAGIFTLGLGTIAAIAAYAAAKAAAEKKKEELWSIYFSQVNETRNKAVTNYLHNFSYQTSLVISQYRNTAKTVLKFSLPDEPDEIQVRRKLLVKYKTTYNDISSNM